VQLTTWHCPHLLLRARAAARLLLTASPPTVQQSIDNFWPPGIQQQTRSSGMRRPGGTDGPTDRQTVGRTPDSCIDPAARGQYR